ncbi:MAG TPA: porin [Xanthobacteraceae bacterium]|nr:porin [Xanthobacteraceae bacterium]
MKMVKSLLLGTAAGLIAVAGAQAADMPVKAKPVLYVKICSLYGDGFYYIPGTDICLKLGGYVRSQHYYNYGNNATNTPFYGTNVLETRIGPQTGWTHRARSLISVDTRQQTEYGTLRTYFTIGHTSDFTATAASAQAIYANRGFIQFAGFTLGLASSFFDFYSSPIVTYFAVNSEDTGDGGWKVAAYTANFGNGVTSTISLEEPRRMVAVNAAIPDFAVVSAAAALTPLYDQATIRFPDIVWNWRIDQAWGAAMIGGAVHDASAGYYASSPDVAALGVIGVSNAACSPGLNVPPLPPNGTLTNSQLCGHPADKLGWVVTAGLRLNAANGSFFQTQASYAEGALKYLSHTQFPTSSAVRFGIGNSLGLGLAMDGIYGVGGEVELTKGFAVYAAYDHVWWAGSRWRTSIYGGYIDVGFSDNAKALIANATCGSAVKGVVNPVNVTAGAVTAMTNCDPDWAIAYIGSRTQYNFTPEFYMGVDVLYTKLSTAFAGQAFFNGVAGLPRPRGFYTVEDQDNVAVTVRFHRDFKP